MFVDSSVQQYASLEPLSRQELHVPSLSFFTDDHSHCKIPIDSLSRIQNLTLIALTVSGPQSPGDTRVAQVVPTIHEKSPPPILPIPKARETRHISVASLTSPPISNITSQSANNIIPAHTSTYNSSTRSPNTVISADSLISLATTSPPAPVFVLNDGTSHTQTLQGIQLRLEYEDTRPTTPVGSPPAFFSITEQEEYCLQHYVRHIGRWVRKQAPASQLPAATLRS